jgi:hypothetical protein
LFFKRKKSGRPVDGPRPDKAIPEGDWPASALAFHEGTKRVVSVILADDETVLDPLPILDRSIYQTAV